jgi:hypothetical protein
MATSTYFSYDEAYPRCVMYAQGLWTRVIKAGFETDPMLPNSHCFKVKMPKDCVVPYVSVSVDPSRYYNSSRDHLPNAIETAICNKSLCLIYNVKYGYPDVNTQFSPEELLEELARVAALNKMCV